LAGLSHRRHGNAADRHKSKDPPKPKADKSRLVAAHDDPGILDVSDASAGIALVPRADPLKIARKLWKHTRVNEGRIPPDRTTVAGDTDRALQQDTSEASA
jgi:hypothetical protein